MKKSTKFLLSVLVIILICNLGVFTLAVNAACTTHDYSIKKGKYFFNDKQHFERYICSACGAIQARNYQNHVVKEGRCVYGCGFVEDVTKCAMNNMLPDHEKYIEYKYEYEDGKDGHVETKYCPVCNMNVQRNQRNHNFNKQVAKEYDNKQHWVIMQCICGKSREENRGYHTTSTDCNFCDFYVEVVECSHSYIAATCTTPKKCSKCGMTTGTVLGHNYSSATCLKPKTCIRCNATSGSVLAHDYNDATCLKPKTCKNCGTTTGTALGHNYAGASCTAGQTCTRCQASTGGALGHNYSAATCVKAKTCTRCGATTGTALGHQYSEATCVKAKTCIRCNVTSGNALGHQYSAATCLKPKTCIRCNITSGSVLAHDYNAATCLKPKTCKSCGTTTGTALGHNYAGASCTAGQTCTRCQVSTGGALGHNYTEATCIKAKTCTRCGTTSGTALGHQYSEATCVKAKTCIRCNVTSGNALGHQYSAATCLKPKTCIRCNITSGNPLEHNYNAATCLKPKTCKNCGTTNGSALGHNYAGATCSAGQICTRCQASSGSALGHNYTEATCIKAKTCTRCGTTSGTALGHQYSEATCVKAKTCIRCNVTSGNALGHQYSAATCLKPKTCIRCNITSGSVLAHDYNAATCLKPKTCKNCGTTNGSALGHNYAGATCSAGQICTRCQASSGSALGHNYTEATCIKAKTCTRCGTTSGTALGHQYSEATCIKAKTCVRCNVTSGNALGHQYSAATCLKPKTCIRCSITSGSVLAHDYNEATCLKPKTCKNCGTTNGSALGHNYAGATCSAGQICTRCKETSGSALGHNYTEATCIKAKTCTRCGTTSGTALGHQYSEATCEKPKTCARCNVTSGGVLNHNYNIKVDGFFFDETNHYEQFKCVCGLTEYKNYAKHNLDSNGKCKSNCGYQKVIEKCALNKLLDAHKNGTEVTYTQNASNHKVITTCKICNIKVKEENKNHEFKTKISSSRDGTYHWDIMKCICEKTSEMNKTKHTYNTAGKCSCGHTKTTFEDIDDDAWYSGDVNDAIDNGLFNGTSDTTFSPELDITRGMFVTVLARMEKADLNNFENAFVDVPVDSYYYTSVSWAVSNGIVQGVGGNQFAPDAPITREAMAQILYNYFTKFHSNMLVSTTNTTPFKDQNQVSTWAKTAVLMLKEMKILNGNPDGTFKPQDVVSRAEGAVIMQRVYEKVKANEKPQQGTTSKYYSPSDFGQDKPVMTETSYTDADWARMEAELKRRINEAGYGTRAAAVEAALYLASLDYALPYRGVPKQRDADIGTYNKIGMNETWGDKVPLTKNVTVYGTTYKKGTKKTNGMDCGAFVSWVLMNAGVLPTGNSNEVGPSTNPFTNDKGSLSSNMRVALGASQLRAHALKNVADEVEPGDMILTYGERNGERAWTHIGIIVGVDANNVYVAEENTTTYNPSTGGSITINKLVVTRVPKTYSKDVLGWVVLCDDKLYKAKNADGTENKGNMPIVWGN